MNDRYLIAALLALATFYGAVVVLFVALQERLLFVNTARYLTPAEAGVDAATEVTIATPDGERLHGWYAAPQPDMPTVLFLHGNAGTISDRSERFSVFAGHGYGVLFVDYRGFGGSTGKPTEPGLVTDAEAAYDWLAKDRNVDPRHMLLLGESLGSGVAVMLAARRPVAAVALESAYSSIVDVAASLYWWLPVRLFIRHPFHADAVIAAINAPLLILHGEQDTVIPIAFGRRLFDLARQPKTFISLPDGAHILFDATVFARENAFFRAAAGLPPQ